jgi:hypothetical protein
MTLDSAADTHILSMDAACLLFKSKTSQLKVIGVSGKSTMADVEGHLVVTVSDGNKTYRIDLGTAYGLSGCPLNILSISKLLNQEAIVHFEAGNCFIKLKNSEPIPIIEKDGMFKIKAKKSDTVLECDSKQAEESENDDIASIDSAPSQPKQSSHSFTLRGKAYSVSTDIKTWHRRVRHMNIKKLLKIHKKKQVLGFKVKNPPKHIDCDCESCKLAKIQRRPNHHSREFKSIANVIGHTVSADVKSVGVETHKGFKYAVVFVDHHSHLGMEYYMRNKHETTKMLKQYINDMWRLGKVKIKNLQTDRGSEFFEQEGESKYNIGRSIHSFSKCCTDNGILHIKRPIEMKEKLAEQWIKEHFRCANTSLIEARMSPIFWVDAVKYSSFQFNRTPNEDNVKGEAPWTMLTGEAVRWDKWKVFGCDVFEHIPNNKYDKIPGIPKGRKQIFLGFTEDMDGHVLFDVMKRTTHTAGNCYFNEDFTNRQNSLIFYDRRRELMKKGETQPLLINDFDTPDEIDHARRLFLDKAQDTEEVNTIKDPIIEKEAQQIVQDDDDVMIRPTRLLPVGKMAIYTEKDKLFLRAMEMTNSPIIFLQPCPKTGNSTSRYRYERYMTATTIRQAFELGATSGDLRWDYNKGYIKFPKNESMSSAHVHHAQSLAEEHRVLHHSDRQNFNHVLETVYEPDVILKMLEDRHETIRFAERNASKVLNSSSIKIDFSLSPEPQQYWDAVNSSESQSWRQAMNDEMESMIRFGVFNRVQRTVAKGRQILGCKWVYKRKTNKQGIVYRYRSRLVCQGFRQKPFDSFQPDETFSPVVHKDSLRLFLSVSAAENLTIYQADVKAAFLQAPLKEKIYVKCPPGYETYDENGEEEVLEMNSACYGLKQSSACFWTAVHTHLVENGYIPTLGDPCLFKKILENGKPILVCCYVDDLTYSAPDFETAEIFLKMMRDRFVIDEGEGQPIEWLLGMAIDQDCQKGTVHMNMELMITKLAHGILTPEEIAKAKNVRTPMLVTPLLKQQTRDVPQSDFDYLSVVGSLLHIANCVRCDISYAVGALARHSLTVGHAHVKAAKRVVMYSYNTAKLGITYFRDTNNVNVPVIYEQAAHPLSNGKNFLQTFVDSDYAMDQTRRSTMGKVLMLNGGPISWGSVLGKTVATSTCEAEVNAAVSAVKDAIHFKQMLVDLDFLKEDHPLQIAEDNSACISQAESGLRHVRNAKHYEVKLRFLQQHVVDKNVKFVYCPTDDQYADLFTKPLEETKFKFFRDLIMIQRN